MRNPIMIVTCVVSLAFGLSSHASPAPATAPESNGGVTFGYAEVYGEPLPEAYGSWTTYGVVKQLDVDWANPVFGEKDGVPFLEVALTGGKLTRMVKLQTEKHGMLEWPLMLVDSPLHIEAPFDFLRALVDAGNAGRKISCLITAYQLVKQLAFKPGTSTPVPSAHQMASQGKLGQPRECRYQ